MKKVLNSLTNVLTDASNLIYHAKLVWLDDEHFTYETTDDWTIADTLRHLRDILEGLVWLIFNLLEVIIDPLGCFLQVEYFGHTVIFIHKECDTALLRILANIEYTLWMLIYRHLIRINHEVGFLANVIFHVPEELITGHAPYTIWNTPKGLLLYKILDKFGYFQ